MEQQDIVKYGGIGIAVIMLFSMFAIGVLYMGKNDSPSDVPTPAAPASEFTYATTFDSTVIKEASAINFVGVTTSMEKMIIDQAIEKISGVRAVSSNLQVLQDGKIGYFAEISLKKDFSANDVFTQILELEFFSNEAGNFEARKYVTITLPKEEIDIYNSDLNIDRTYSFDSNIFTTLTALVSMETLPKDEITITGTINLTGGLLTGYSLEEEINKTNEIKQYSVKTKLSALEIEPIILFEGQADANTLIDANLTLDENTLKEELGVAGIDANVSVFEFGSETTYVFGDTKAITKSTELRTLLIANKVDSNTIKIVQPALFSLESIMIPELGKTLEFADKNFSANINAGHTTSEEIELNLEISVQREVIIQISAIESGLE